MSDNWISIEDNLPKIGHIIEIKTEKPLSIMNATFTIINWCSENSNYHVNHKHTDVFVFKGLIGDYINNVTHWRPIQEKRPDFGKLNIGDKLIIEIMPNDSKGSKVIEYFGYFQGISEANMFEISINTYSFIGDCISVSRVKKITRINIDKQTFEEI